MILDEDLTDFEKQGKLCYLPVVQNPDENWSYARGRVTRNMLEHFMPFDYEDQVSDSVIMVCGPPDLKNSINEITKEMGLKNVFFFN